jgi:pimeloyl-ACP methyl ester carboxylesterase
VTRTDLNFTKLNIQTRNGLINVNYFKGTPTYIMMHGLGGSKKLFEDAFQVNSNYGWGILTTDLLGFGESEKNKKVEDYSLHNQSFSILDVINFLEIKEHYLVAHSMTTALLPYLLEKNKETVGVIMLEGNLIKEDAQWSKKISEFTDSEFVKYVSNLKKHASRILSLQLHSNLDERKIDDYSKSFQVMDAEAFRIVAKETYQMTYSDKIIEQLKKFQGLKSYWRGGKSEFWNGQNLIREINSQYNILENSLHYLMLDNPKKLYYSIYDYAYKNNI